MAINQSNERDKAKTQDERHAIGRMEGSICVNGTNEESFTEMFGRVLKSYGSKEKKKGSERAICPRAIYPRPTNDVHQEELDLKHTRVDHHSAITKKTNLQEQLLFDNKTSK